METISREIIEIRTPFLEKELKSLRLGTRFKNGIPEIFKDYTILKFLEEFDPEQHSLIGCARKELDLFRLYLEAHGVDWHEYKIKRLFKNNYFVKGAFFDQNELRSTKLTTVYMNLHSKRRRVESIQLKMQF